MLSLPPVHKLSELTTEIEFKKSENKKAKRKIRKANDFVSGFDIEQLRTDKAAHDSRIQEIDELTLELEGYDEQIKQSRNQVELLGEVPCGSEFSHCKFIRGAYEAKDNIELVQLAINNTKKTKQGATKQVGAMHIKEISP